MVIEAICFLCKFFFQTFSVDVYLKLMLDCQIICTLLYVYSQEVTGYQKSQICYYKEKPNMIRKGKPMPIWNFNTHFTFLNLPKQVTERNCKLIFIQRNPKDVLVSYLPFFQGYNIIESTVKWEEFIDKYMEIGKCSSHRFLV